MSEVDKAVIKPEMLKSYIWLQTADGSIQQVEQEVAMFCPLICQEVIQKGMGSSKNCSISLPQRVNPAMLSLILDYCRFHQIPGHSNKERKSFDEKFVRMDTKRLCELTSAADSLQLKPLVDLTSRTLARIIEGKTPEENQQDTLVFPLVQAICVGSPPIRIARDLSQQPRVSLPILTRSQRHTTDDPRIRLLNRLYARKRKELKDREKLKIVETEEEHVDDRSVDDLLSFINGGHEDSKDIKTSKSKKKNRKRKDQQKNTCTAEAVQTPMKESNGYSSACHSAEADNKLEPHQSGPSKWHDVKDDTFASKVDSGDADIDDEIDPELKKKIDREVEDFERILNSGWPERMQEILCSSQERRPVPFPIIGNGSLGRKG